MCNKVLIGFQHVHDGILKAWLVEYLPYVLVQLSLTTKSLSIDMYVQSSNVTLVDILMTSHIHVKNKSKHFNGTSLIDGITMSTARLKYNLKKSVAHNQVFMQGICDEICSPWVARLSMKFITFTTRNKKIKYENIILLVGS